MEALVGTLASPTFLSENMPQVLLRRSKRIAEQNKKNEETIKRKRVKSQEEPLSRESGVLKNQVEEVQLNLHRTETLLAQEKRKRCRLHEKLKIEIRKVEKHNKDVQHLLNATLNLTKTQSNKITELESKLSNCKDHEKLKECLDRERERTEAYRLKWLEQIEKSEISDGKDGGEPHPWKVCEICAFPYGPTADRVPRVLSCGHTLCTECAGKIVSFNSIRCPFDRRFAVMGRDGVDGLPKNFALLNM